MIDKSVNTACLYAQPHQNYNQTIEPPSLWTVRNQAEWMSNNYGTIEVTSIQTDRKDKEVEQDGPTFTCGG